MCLLIHSYTLWILIGVLLSKQHLVCLWIIVFSVVFSVEIRRILNWRTISIFIILVSTVLSSLRSLVALLVSRLSSGGMINAVFVLLVNLIIVISFLVMSTRFSNIASLLIIIDLNNTSFISHRMLTQNLNLTAVDATLVIIDANILTLLFFIFVNQTLNVIVLR